MIISLDKYKATGGGSGGSDTGGLKYSGHADAEGLRAIGWTDEDIVYYQENGVNWNKEDDEYHKVTDDNKALYGVLTTSNISTYKDRIVYLPKIDTSGITNMSNMFSDCYSLVTIPMLDTSSVTNMSSMFNNCHSLVTIPMLDTSKVSDMSNMFKYCTALVHIPLLDTSKVSNMRYMFAYCAALVTIPMLDTNYLHDCANMFNGCRVINNINKINLFMVQENDTSANFANNCYSLQHIQIDNIYQPLNFSSTKLLSKESILYIINSLVHQYYSLTLTLSSHCLSKLTEDEIAVATAKNWIIKA